MRHFTYLPLAFLLLTAIHAEPVPPAKDKEPKPAKEKEATSAHDKWTVDDVLLAPWASQFQIAPDGRSVVWVRTAMDKDKGERLSHVFRTDLGEAKKEVQLTRGNDGCFAPRWSPDGKLLAFLSDRPVPKAKDKARGKGRKGDDDEPKTQVWLMDPFGGEPWVLTDYPRGVTGGFQWAGPDTIVFVSQEEATLRENTLKDEKKDTSVVVEDEKHEPPQRLFKVDVKSKKVTRVSDNTDRIESFAVSPDGKYAAAINSQSLRYTYNHKVKPAAFLFDLETGESRRILNDPKLNLGAVRWSPDSKGFYVVNQFSDTPQYNDAVILELLYYDVAAKSHAKVDLDWANGLATETLNEDGAAFEPTADGFVALLAAGSRHKAARYVRAGDGWKREFLTGKDLHHLNGFAVAPNGKGLVYAHSTASTPTQWYHAELAGAHVRKPAAIAELNENVNKLPRAKAEVVKWKGAQDEDVEGVLYYPHHYKDGEKYPLVVMIHGGPFGADLDAWEESWAYAPNLYNQRGAFVLRPNYHGSSNYGLKWATSIAAGKYYDLPLVDIERGVDALIERGLVDANRLGTLGWSNGAILTTALIARTTRFKAAAPGAGGAEWVADWGTCEFGDSFDRYYFGKSPLEDPQLYLKMAPLYQFDKVRTPTLIFQGEIDRVVPVHHAWTQYRALQELGKTDVRLVLFPGEKHSLKKYVHQRRKLEEELAWFDKYLFKTAKSENEALKNDSPLARALKLKGAKRDGARYGVKDNGVLIPETVKHGKLQVGRFEVTRAQFAEFDNGYVVEPGTDNYPANGITFEQAKDYCAWLSKKTGESYRLPNEEEAEELYEKAEHTENTLDYWAGYAVNPDDAKQLQEKVKELGGKAPLLRAVGSFQGVGEEEMVFDLGGNVAEWVEKKDGKGELQGGSADRPADAKQGTSRPALEYQGFRVVKER
jgi:dipeptidyl aminopeptidase/acylaminoacyl peptidase